MPIVSMQDELNSWYEKNCNNGYLSWAVLSRRTGVSVPTITKIAKGEIARPKFETVDALLKVIAPDRPGEVSDFIVSEYGGGTIQFDPEWITPRKRFSQEIMRLFDDSLTYRLFKLAMSGSNSVAGLCKDFGESEVMARIQLLVEKGLVRIDEENRLIRTQGSQYTFNGDVFSVAREIKHMVDIVAEKKSLAKTGPTDVDQNANRLLFYNTSLTEDTIRDFNDEVSGFMQKIAEKYKFDVNKGGKEVFISIAFGRFDRG